MVEVIFTNSCGDIIDSFDEKGFKWKIVDNIDKNEKTRILQEEAIAFSQSENYQAAISKFNEAILSQNYIPQLYYDLAYTYLLAEDSDNAYRIYKKLDEIVPEGYFETKTYLYILQDEKENKMPEGFCIYYTQIEDLPKSEEKVKLLKELINTYGAYPPLIKELIKIDLNDKALLIDNALSNSPDMETKGFLLISLALMKKSTNKNESIEILKGIINNNKSTIVSIELSKLMIKHFVKE